VPITFFGNSILNISYGGGYSMGNIVDLITGVLENDGMIDEAHPEFHNLESVDGIADLTLGDIVPKEWVSEQEELRTLYLRHELTDVYFEFKSNDQKFIIEGTGLSIFHQVEAYKYMEPDFYKIFFTAVHHFLYGLKSTKIKAENAISEFKALANNSGSQVDLRHCFKQMISFISEYKYAISLLPLVKLSAVLDKAQAASAAVKDGEIMGLTEELRIVRLQVKLLTEKTIKLDKRLQEQEAVQQTMSDLLAKNGLTLEGEAAFKGGEAYKGATGPFFGAYK
jgi:hypothetical protein